MDEPDTFIWCTQKNNSTHTHSWLTWFSYFPPSSRVFRSLGQDYLSAVLLILLSCGQAVSSTRVSDEYNQRLVFSAAVCVWVWGTKILILHRPHFPPSDRAIDLIFLIFLLKVGGFVNIASSREWFRSWCMSSCSLFRVTTSSGSRKCIFSLDWEKEKIAIETSKILQEEA